MNTKTNPDLLNPESTVQVAVSALAAITMPQGNTKQEQFVYFRCSMDQACFHRKDGKKLPFMHHFFKTQFKEDITYLMNEVEAGNPYLRLASKEEVEHAKMVEDPLGTIRENVKKELSIEDLEKLLAERRGVVPSGQANSIATSANDASKIAEVNKKTSDVLAAGGVNNLNPSPVNVVHAAHTGANTATLGALLKK